VHLSFGRGFGFAPEVDSSEIERQNERLSLNPGDSLLDQITQKHGADVLFVARLMDVRTSLGIDVLELPLNGYLAAFAETELSGPGIQANLANLKADQELQILSYRKWIHQLKVVRALIGRNFEFLARDRHAPQADSRALPGDGHPDYRLGMQVRMSIRANYLTRLKAITL